MNIEPNNSQEKSRSHLNGTWYEVPNKISIQKTDAFPRNLLSGRMV